MISACIQQLTTTSLSSSAGTRHWSCTSCSTGGRSTAKSLSQNITPSGWPCGICPPRSNVSLQSHSILPAVASSQTRECDWRIDQSRRQERTESGMSVHPCGRAIMNNHATGLDVQASTDQAGAAVARADSRRSGRQPVPRSERGDLRAAVGVAGTAGRPSVVRGVSVVATLVAGPAQDRRARGAVALG